MKLKNYNTMKHVKTFESFLNELSDYSEGGDAAILAFAWMEFTLSEIADLSYSQSGVNIRKISSDANVKKVEKTIAEELENLDTEELLRIALAANAESANDNTDDSSYPGGHWVRALEQLVGQPMSLIDRKLSEYRGYRSSSDFEKEFMYLGNSDY